MSKFCCTKCGSENLIYEKYVKCKTPVDIQDDGTIVYLQSIIDEDDSLPTCYGFYCADCGQAVIFKADIVKSETELKEMLSMSEEELERINDEYLSIACDCADYEEERRAEIEEARQFCEKNKGLLK